MRKIRTSIVNDDLVIKRRNEIVKNALKVFLKNGYEQTTMRDLAQSCRMTQGNLYNYIGSKEDILHLIVLTSAIGGQPLTELYKLGNLSYSDILREAMTAHYKNTNFIGEQLLIINRHMRAFSSQDSKLLLESEISIASFFEELIKRGVEAGEFQCDDPLLLAHDIIMFSNDWVLRKWFLKRHYTLDEYTQKHIQMVMRLLKADKS